MEEKIIKAFKPAGKTPFNIISEKSDIAVNSIKASSKWLCSYFGAVHFENLKFTGLEMDVNNSKFKVLSCNTSFTLPNSDSCVVTISNPFNYTSPRFYTRLFNKRLHWTEKRVILNSEILSDFILFKVFEKDLEGIIKHLEQKGSVEKIDSQDIFGTIALSSPSKKEKEEAFDRFVKKAFNGK